MAIILSALSITGSASKGNFMGPGLYCTLQFVTHLTWPALLVYIPVCSLWIFQFVTPVQRDRAQIEAGLMEWGPLLPSLLTHAFNKAKGMVSMASCEKTQYHLLGSLIWGQEWGWKVLLHRVEKRKWTSPNIYLVLTIYESTVLSAFHLLFHLSITTSLRGSFSYTPHIYKWGSCTWKRLRKLVKSLS